jgi:hypothetical protein
MEKFRLLEEFLQKWQLFCVCHRYRDDYARDFVRAI